MTKKSSIPGINTIVFDLGGVILDLDRDAAINAFNRLGFYEADDLLNNYRQKGIFKELEQGLISAEEFHSYIRIKAGKNISGEEIDFALNSFISGLSVYKLQMLESLRKRFKVYALSNINTIITSSFDNKWFGQSGKNTADYFDGLFFSYEMKMLKPDDEIYEKLISDTGLVPGETLYIDDAQANIDAGLKFGFNVYMPSNKEDFRHIFELL